MVSSWEPPSARLSALTVQLLDSSKRKENGESGGALWDNSAFKLLVVASADDRQRCLLRRWRESAAKIRLLE